MTSTCQFLTLTCLNNQTRGRLTVYFLSLLCLWCLVAPVAAAQETVKFAPAQSYKHQQAIEFIQKNVVTTNDMQLAQVDLNDDFIDEYILKPVDTAQCANTPLCPHYIIAWQDDALILIGQFNAKKLVIGTKKDYGVRQLILYNHPYNDYRTVTTYWNPHRFQYVVP